MTITLSHIRGLVHTMKPSLSTHTTMSPTRARMADAAWLTAINMLGIVLTMAQLPLVALVSFSGRHPSRPNTLLKHATQLMWDAHDWLEHAELHPPSIWH